MPNLSPWNIFYPDQTTGLTPLASKFAQMAQSVSDALTVVNRGVVPPVANQAARDALFPSGVRVLGSRVRRLDLGWDEQYYTAYNSGSNPGGATPAGWYPVPGSDAGPLSGLWSRSATDSWTATTDTNVMGFTFPKVPQGMYHFDIAYSWGTDAATAAQHSLILDGGLAYGFPSDHTGATRSFMGWGGHFPHDGGDFTFAFNILAPSAGTKTIFTGGTFSYEYMGTIQG